MARPPRNVWKNIVVNFINSLKPRQIRGDYKGTDVLGNKYFEIPPDPSRGKRRASRWFEPVIKEDFEQELPSEWQSWLRGRRTTPPTEAEIAGNTKIMLMKKDNAAKLEADKKPSKSLEVEAPKRGMESFPDYGSEFEIVPGHERKRK